MTPAEAEALAAATLAAIAADDQAFLDRFGHHPPYDSPREKHRRVDRERVASDLAGLRAHGPADDCGWGERPCPDRRRYADGLRRTAALYGVTP